MIPKRQNITPQFNLYDQALNDLGTLSGVVDIDMAYAFNKFTLSGNITSITTSNNLGLSERAMFTFSVVQDATVPYSIDWLIDGIFVSSKNSADLQPDQALGSITRYTCAWGGIKYELQIDK